MATVEFKIKNIKAADGTAATLAEVQGSIDATSIGQFTNVMDKLVEKGVVETDPQGHFRLKKVEPGDRRKRTWISPQVRRILERSARDFSTVIAVEDDEEL